MKNPLKVTTPTDREVVMTRVFDAPRSLVWETLHTPELVKRWMSGSPGWSLVVCENDPRVGGTFRWEWRGPDGVEMKMSGVYREVVAPERVVRTQSFQFGSEPRMGEQVTTTVLAEQGDKTKLTFTVIYPSKEARDLAIAHGMEQGMSAGYDQLDEMLAQKV